LPSIRTTHRPLSEAMPRLPARPHGRGGDFSSDVWRYLMMMVSNSKPGAVGTSRSQPDAGVYPHTAHRLIQDKISCLRSDRFLHQERFCAWQLRRRNILLGDCCSYSEVSSRFKTHIPNI